MKNTTRQTFNDLVIKSKLLTKLYVLYMHHFIKRMKQKNDKISMGHYGTTDMFQWVAIETTNKCTRKCSYCPLKQDKTKRKLLPNWIVYKVLRELKDKDYIGEICFSNYGEPCLDKRLSKFIKKAREYFPNAVINMSTNGDVLTVKKFRELKEAGMNQFVITQHGNMEPENHKSLKANLTEEEKKLIIWVYLDENSLLSNRGGSVQINSKRIPKKICYQSTFIVRANGTVTLCCHDYFGEITLGDLKDKSKSIYNIWFDPENVKLRKELYQGIAKRDICKRCYLFQEGKRCS